MKRNKKDLKEEVSSELREALDRLKVAEEILDELASGYWCAILDEASKPLPRSYMGQRIQDYWKTFK